MDKRKLRVDAVIFDLDGTLIDSTDIYFKIIRIVFEQLGLPAISKTVFLYAIKEGGFDWDFVLPNEMKKQKKEIIIKAREMIMDIYPDIFQREVKLILGADDLLKELSAGGIKIGMVTSTPMKDMEVKLYPLKASDVVELFEVIITSDDAPRVKPAADPLIECVKRLGITMEKSVYVGDMRVDIKAAKAAGMKTISVLTGFEDYETLKTEHPDMIIDSVADLRDTIHITSP